MNIFEVLSLFAQLDVLLAVLANRTARHAGQLIAVPLGRIRVANTVAIHIASFAMIRKVLC